MTLTRVFVIISISLSLEGLVYVFRAGEIDISLLPYPAVLILTSILTMVALGHYQKNSVVTENDLLIDSYAKTDRLLAKKLLFKREAEDDLAIEEARIRRIALEVAADLKVEEARDRRIIKETQEDKQIEHARDRRLYKENEEDMGIKKDKEQRLMNDRINREIKKDNLQQELKTRVRREMEAEYKEDKEYIEYLAYKNAKENKEDKRKVGPKLNKKDKDQGRTIN